MKITNTNNSISTAYQNQKVAFKQGLTRDIVNYVKNMPSNEYSRVSHRLWKKYGIIANVSCSNTIAFCLEQTAGIMNRAGFKLPKYFKFVPLDVENLGKYEYTDTVKINSNLEEFLDLEQLSKAEERKINYNGSDYFLDTYLHEFLHAAHCNQIIEKYGKDKGAYQFEDELSSYGLMFTLRQPLLQFVKTLFPAISDNQFTTICPEKIKLHSCKDLREYFAEKSAIKIEIQLGDNFNIEYIQPNVVQSCAGFPENWNINEVKKIFNIPFLKRIMGKSLNPSERDEIITKMPNNILCYFEGEIWNGNINGINKKSRAFRDYGKKHANK